jgi:hypothetical protein
VSFHFDPSDHGVPLILKVFVSFHFDPSDHGVYLILEVIVSFIALLTGAAAQSIHPPGYSIRGYKLV